MDLLLVGFGVGMYDDIVHKDRTAGEAITHNTVSAGLGVLGVIGVGALVSNPVGWAAIGVAAAGAAAGFLLSSGFNWAYEHNILHIKDGLDWAGHQIDRGWDEAKETVSDIVNHPGEAIKSGLDAINPFS